jgi:hypothetical protein
MADEQIDIGSKIITIAIMLNGNIIETNLASTKQKIFDNTRLFKLAPNVSEPGTVFDEIQKNNISISRIDILNKVFQQDLLLSTYNAVEQIPGVLSGYKSLYLPEKHRYIPFNITFDKEIGTATLPADANMVVGVYVVSVLEKTGEDKFKLIYPIIDPSVKDDTERNPNLLKKEEFIEFENIFRKTGASILNKMFEKSSKLPVYDKKPENRTNYKAQLDKWNITFSPGGFLSFYGDILYIRLSYLVDVIKEIVGHSKCKINIFDYSPDVLSPILNSDPSGKLYSQYMVPYDIEMGADKSWGGKSIKRRIKRHKKRRNTRRRRAKK